MASEPKRPMEQMLEALAKARRAEFGDDPKMPNPMRARLHDEIARAGAAEGEKSESRPSWLTMFWPRVTVAAALATLLVLVPAIWWNQSHPIAGSGNLALRDRATAGAAQELNPALPAENTLSNAPTAASASKPAVNLADNSQVKIESGGATAAKAEEWAASAGVRQGSSIELPSEETKGLDKEIASAKTKSAPAAAPPVVADSKDSEGMAKTKPPASQPLSAGSVATVQQFSQQQAVQSFRNNAQQASRAENVLNTFQVQQDGNEIRVVDADGSTYTGRIEQVAKSAKLNSGIAARHGAMKQMPAFAAKPAQENELASPQSYFRATGYNVSLKKSLVFEGNYDASPQQQPTMNGSDDRQRAEQSSGRARIVGTVRVNGEAPMEVDAIAETPESPAATEKSEK